MRTSELDIRALRSFVDALAATPDLNADYEHIVRMYLPNLLLDVEELARVQGITV